MRKFMTAIFTIVAILSLLGKTIENTKAVSTDGPSGDYVIQYNYNPEETNDREIYIWKLCYAGGDPSKIGQKIADPADMGEPEEAIYEAIAFYNYLTYDGLVEFLNDGFMTEYIDEFIIVGRLPEGFTLDASTPESKPEEDNTPSNDTQKDEINNSSNNENITSKTPAVEKNPEINTELAGTYVVIDDGTKSYSTYKANKELKTWEVGTKVSVEGLLSNGYYKVSFESAEHYIDKSHLAPIAEYETAWTESSRTESVCEIPGSITYTNTISEETKTEELPPLEHDYKEVETVESTCAKEGYVKSKCVLCNKEKLEAFEKTNHTLNKNLKKNGNVLFYSHVDETKCVECEESIKVDLWKLSIRKIVFEIALCVAMLVFGIIAIKRFRKK